MKVALFLAATFGSISVSADVAETVVSLASLRGILSGYESSIIQSALARSNFNATAETLEVERYNVKCILEDEFGLDASSNPSVASTVPDDRFTNGVPYIYYNRTSDDATRYGDNEGAQELANSIWSLTWSTVIPQPVNASNTSSLDYVTPLSASSSSMLSLAASRVSLGRFVALAKLYDATAVSTSIAAKPNATLCDLLAAGNAPGVRTRLTDRKQEDSVRNSVTSKALLYTNTTAEAPSPFVGNIVGMFNL